MNKVEKIKKILDVPTDWRLGQYLWNKMNEQGRWEAPEANDLFFISDKALEKIL